VKAEKRLLQRHLPQFHGIHQFLAIARGAFSVACSFFN
jgi:hypothetical protein